ncbi:MAG TPA: hypothetical protein VFX13_11115 [Gaiellales bacterium]|nr:hypothetical protein [Gaiellales bacterium]
MATRNIWSIEMLDDHNYSTLRSVEPLEVAMSEVSDTAGQALDQGDVIVFARPDLADHVVANLLAELVDDLRGAE